MSFSWGEFIDLAIRLRADEANATSHRTAISRAYYGAYHAASAFVRAREFYPSGQPHTHDLVGRHIRNAAFPHSAALAKLGFDLNDARIGADDRNPFPGNLGRAADDAIANTVAIITLLQAHSSFPQVVSTSLSTHMASSARKSISPESARVQQAIPLISFILPLLHRDLSADARQPQCVALATLFLSGVSGMDAVQTQLVSGSRYIACCHSHDESQLTERLDSRRGR